MATSLPLSVPHPIGNRYIGELQAFGLDDDIPREQHRAVHTSGSTEKVALGCYIDHLHPFVRDGCAQLLMDGYHAQAIAELGKRVEQGLRLESWKLPKDDWVRSSGQSTTMEEMVASLANKLGNTKPGRSRVS